MSKLLCGLLVIALATAFSTPAQAENSKITVHNNSSFAIHHLFLSHVGEDKWGPDQLGKHVIAPGGEYELQDVPCADYDLKLVDEDGDECEVQVPEVCGADEDWNVEDEGLLECEGFGK